MKLRYQIACFLTGFVVLVIVGALVPPPPESDDLLFKVGWYLGGVMSHIENLFR
jgi:hypothetical protein